MPEAGMALYSQHGGAADGQGLGIGHKLMDAIEEYAIANGFETLFLYTTYFSPGAIRAL